MRALERIIQILDVVSGRGEGASLADLVRGTGISKTALHRIAGDLCDSRLLIRDRGGRYQPGPKILEWSGLFRRDNVLLAAARPIIQKLQETVGEAVHLFMYDGTGAYYLDQIESGHAVRMTYRIGSRAPLHSTGGGKAVLANLSCAERRGYYRRSGLPGFTPNTITDAERLEEDLAASGESGLYREVGENEGDIRCLAAAVLDAGGRPLGAISITVPIYRYRECDQPGWEAALLRAKNQLEYTLGKEKERGDGQK